MRRNLYYLLVCFHLGCTVTYSLHSTIRGYYRLQAAAGSGFLHALQNATGQVVAWPLLNTVARHAGIATGYGFFAPQVGSSFLLEVCTLDDDGQVSATAFHPPLVHPHSLLRFHSLLNRLQQLLPDDTGSIPSDSLSYRQARAIAHCIGQRIAGTAWGHGTRQLRVTVSVYHHSSLRTGRLGGKRFVIYQHELPQLSAP